MEKYKKSGFFFFFWVYTVFTSFKVFKYNFYRMSQEGADNFFKGRQYNKIDVKRKSSNFVMAQKLSLSMSRMWYNEKNTRSKIRLKKKWKYSDWENLQWIYRSKLKPFSCISELKDIMKTLPLKLIWKILNNLMEIAIYSYQIRVDYFFYQLS